MNNKVQEVKAAGDKLLKQGLAHVQNLRSRFSQEKKEKNPTPKSKKEEAATPTGGTTATSFFLRFSVKDQTLFAKRLSFLVKAGVPIVESLHLIRKQTKGRGKTRVYDAVIDDVSNGQYLSTSLAKFRRLFGDFTINIIKVGETSGVLSQNLLYLADELAKKHALQRKVMGALIYPIFITTATLGVTGMITVYIFPKIMPIFTSLHVDLPLTTRILIAASVFLQSWGVTLILAFVVIAGVFAFLRSRVEWLRYRVDWLLLYIPIVSNITRAYNLANICRTLGLLLKSGLFLSESMVVVAETTGNRVYSKACFEVAQCILKGEPISRSFELRNDIFPDTLAHMVSIGESTGNLSGSLTYLAELYEGEVEELTKGLSSSIEPILMVVMGILVGLIAVSVITPIYAITQHLTPR